MTDEDESTDPGIIVAAESAILKFLRDREANEAAPEDRGTSTVNQLARHPASANPVYGLNPGNSLLTFGVDAGPVPNKTDLQSFCDIITERLKRLYDVRGPHVEG